MKASHAAVSRLLFIIIFMTVALSGVRGEEEERTQSQDYREIDLKFDEKIPLKGELEPYLKFSVKPPDKERKWAKWLKGLLVCRNRTDNNKYISLSVALFDRNGKLVGAGMTPRMKDTIVKPGRTHTSNLDFALVEISEKDIAKVTIHYMESDTPLLEY